MKSILKKAAGITVAVTLAFGMFGCSHDSDDDDPVVAVETPVPVQQLGQKSISQQTALHQQQQAHSTRLQSALPLP